MEGQDGAGEVEARLADMLEEQAREQVWYGMVWYITITKPPLLQRSRLTGGGSPNLVGLIERKSM